MRTTLSINKELMDEVKTLSSAKTKKAAVEKALEEYVRKGKAKKLLELEGKIELSFTTKELIERRREVSVNRSIGFRVRLFSICALAATAGQGPGGLPKGPPMGRDPGGRIGPGGNAGEPGWNCQGLCPGPSC